MSDQETEGEEPPKKSKKPLLIGLVLAMLLGGAGFFAVYTGKILAPEDHSGESAQHETAQELEPVAFVDVDPLVINLSQNGVRTHLRFRASLEVAPQYQAEVTAILPRVTDVLNGYLRAVGVRDLEDPVALIRLRAQMLRRIQIVTGQDRVRDLLILEFVLT